MVKNPLSSRRFLVFLAVSFFAALIVPGQAESETCNAQDSDTCGNGADAVDDEGFFQVIVINKSGYRADIYWDDGRFGVNVGDIGARGGQQALRTQAGHQFFITRHGVREGLFDLESDTQVRFEITGPTGTLVIPADVAPSDNPCQDRFSICRRESASGGCQANPGWMIVNCCKSCNKYMDAESLIDPKVRCSPENLNTTAPTWQPGDLNALFESWATDPKFRLYEPQVLSSPDGKFGGASGPWVVTFDNFFSSTEAEALVRGGHMVGFDRSTDQGAVNSAGEMEKVVSKSRTSSNAWCVRECEALPEVHAVTGRIEEVTNIPRSHYESFQILEYGEDQFYRMHHDSSSDDKTPAGPRILTFFLYLSDVEEGGETYFNQLKLGVKPKQGRALVWPSVLDHNPSKWDPRMYHEAKDVVKGKKLAANHWIHLRDYNTPNVWGCTGSFG